MLLYFFIMKFKWKIASKIFLLLTFTFFYCEYLIHYVVISQCSWPNLQHEQNNSVIRAMFLADIHLLGPFRGHWFDKLRREWQMYRSFQSAVSIYEPDVVFILGDLFDEGQWCDEAALQNYINRFFSLFKVPKKTQLYVVPGNHDLGFHYVLRPYLLYKFEKVFNISSVQFLNLKGSYFILLNSMAMEGDGCNICSEAEKKLKIIAAELECVKNRNCINKTNLTNYNRPIIVQHFPMYRKSDAECSEIDEAPQEIKNSLFREKWDCLSKKASEEIYNELNPRVIFTGHTHHGCHIVHRDDIHEYTLSSFNWRNKNNPTFTLVKFTPNQYSTKKCTLLKETTVFILYSSVFLGCVIWIFMRKKTFK